MEKPNKTAHLLIKYGKILVGIALVGLFVVMFPAIKNEFKYAFLKGSLSGDSIVEDEKGKITQIVAKDKDFSVIIPKIGANSKVIKDVDPYNKDEYLQALRTGVAHAKGTSTPDLVGNTFLFAHSSDNFYNANRYNSVFYLLNKLVEGDEFYIVYEEGIYKYEVIEAATVEEDAIEYISSEADENIATLMTCWPPGTTLKRHLVVGKLTFVQN